MNISAVGSAGGYVPPVRTQSNVPARPAAPVSVASDSDGDNDGSKGGSVDVRA